MTFRGSDRGDWPPPSFSGRAPTVAPLWGPGRRLPSNRGPRRPGAGSPARHRPRASGAALLSGLHTAGVSVIVFAHMLHTSSTHCQQFGEHLPTFDKFDGQIRVAIRSLRIRLVTCTRGFLGVASVCYAHSRRVLSARSRRAGDTVFVDPEDGIRSWTTTLPWI